LSRAISIQPKQYRRRFPLMGADEQEVSREYRE
jgi:hypothetical protein